MTAVNKDGIELRVDDIVQLFHTLDPYPFRERDLDREAEEYIVGWARELAADQPIRTIVLYRRLSQAAVEPRPYPVAASETTGAG